MSIVNFSIDGFKCFKSKTDFELGNLTVLTGNNGTGKSSVIQSLLLIRAAIERNLSTNASLNFDSANWKGYKTPLNSVYELSLGIDTDIFNFEIKEGKSLKYIIDGDEFEIDIPLNALESGMDAIDLKLTKSINNRSNIPFWLKKEFYYLNAERLGPRHSSEMSYTNFTNCGYKGEYTAQVILKNEFDPIPPKRRIKSVKSEKLKQQVEGWLDFICPGMSVQVAPLGTLHAELRIKNSTFKEAIRATNIGFGISYSLPIIVSGLIAKEDSMLIIENPEAHLHPKAQSNLGLFLGTIAASGVRIIIETHSEHILNGIRKSYVYNSERTNEDVRIYFFENSKQGNKIQSVSIKENGDLIPFPRNFFDQVQQDVVEILKSRKSIE